MKIFKNKILISFLVIIFLLLSSVGIYYFFFYDPNVYLEYGDKDTIFSFKYPNTLVISSEIPTLLEAYQKDVYSSSPVFGISILNLNERKDFRFSKEYLDSIINQKAKIIDSKIIKKYNKIIYYYFIDEGGRRQKSLITLPDTSFRDGVLLDKNTYFIALSYYGFDNKYDDKVFNVLLNSLKEDNLVGKMVFYEVKSKLKMITDSVVSNGKPVITKQWYFEAEKTFDYWKGKKVLSQDDIGKIQKLIDEYRIYLN